MLFKKNREKETATLIQAPANGNDGNMEIVDNILEAEKERILKLNEAIEPAKPEGVSSEVLEALKDATNIPQMTDSDDKGELEKTIDKEIETLEQKKENLGKMLGDLEEKLKIKGKMSAFAEFWK